MEFDAVVIIVFIVCLLPSIAFYLWLRKLQKDKPGYTDSCKMALVNGIIAAGPIIVAAAILDIIGVKAGLRDTSALLWAAYQSFVLFALTEEMCKFLFFRRVLHKTTCNVSSFDSVAFMVLVGVGFGILESVVYGFSSGLGQALVRGLMLMHGVFGFIMGYFYAKAVKTGKKGFYIASFLIPFLFHGTFDFALSPELNAFGDVASFAAVGMAIIAVILLVVMIAFFARKKHDDTYTAPLV